MLKSFLLIEQISLKWLEEQGRVNGKDFNRELVASRNINRLLTHRGAANGFMNRLWE